MQQVLSAALVSPKYFCVLTKIQALVLNALANMKVMGSQQCWHPWYSGWPIAAGALSKLQPSARYALGPQRTAMLESF